MKIIDLSHTIEANMPVYPGTASPSLVPANTIEHHGFAETMLHMVSHTGTHVDAPAHMLAGAAALDDFPLAKFFGLALIIDYPPCAGSSIELTPLTQMEDKIARAEFVLFHTRHSQKWGQPAYFEPYPTLTPQAAEYLTGFSLKGLGVDAIGFDPIDSIDNPIHHILLGKGLVLVENLCNFEAVQGEYCMFGALPLKYVHADGSPVRAFAIEMATSI